MVIDEKRLKRQQGIIDKWLRETKGKGTLEACTGFGKTYTAIIAIHRFRKKYPHERINVVVPTVPLKEQWEQVLRDNKLIGVYVYVVNTYIRNSHECAFLIPDEIHRYASDEFHKVLEFTKYDLLLGLTATLERGDGRHSLIEELAPIFDTVSLAEAKREGYVTQFKVFNFGLELSEKDRENYEKLHSTFNNTYAYFGRNFEVAMNCAKGKDVKIQVGLEQFTGSQYRERFAKSNEWNGEEEHFYHPKNVMIKARQWLSAMRLRKTFIYTASCKVDVIKEIIKHFPNKKAIIFSEDSKFADDVTKALGNICRSYHTKLETETRTEKIEKFLKNGTVKTTYKTIKLGVTRLKREILELYRLGKIWVLSTVRMLDEGYDNEEIELAIMASYNSSKRQDTQRTGRAVRINSKDSTKESIVINLYIIGTQEEKWLREKQRDKGGIINVTSIEEIINYTGSLQLV